MGQFDLIEVVCNNEILQARPIQWGENVDDEEPQPTQCELCCPKCAQLAILELENGYGETECACGQTIKTNVSPDVPEDIPEDIPEQDDQISISEVLEPADVQDEPPETPEDTSNGQDMSKPTDVQDEPPETPEDTSNESSMSLNDVIKKYSIQSKDNVLDIHEADL